MMAIKRRSAHQDPAPPQPPVPEPPAAPLAADEGIAPTSAELKTAATTGESSPPTVAGTATRATSAGRSVMRTRISGLWIAIGCFAIILVFLLIFILQNGTPVKISFLGISGHLQLGIAMLFAALVGTVLTGLAGTARILQLRAAARRRAKHQPSAG
jgi:uncharacterized integral membrane protein